MHFQPNWLVYSATYPQYMRKRPVFQFNSSRIDILELFRALFARKIIDNVGFKEKTAQYLEQTLKDPGFSNRALLLVGPT